MSDTLNKFEKRDLVIKLRHKEGKTYREICQIARISPNEIKIILKKYEQSLENNKRRTDNNQESTTKKVSLGSQSFTLFREGKKLDEVKILLDIPFQKTKIFWKQYLESIRLEDCYEFYQEHSYDIPTFLSINNFMKKNNILGNNIVNVLREANDVNNLHQTHSNLENEVKYLEQRRMYLSYTPRSPYSLQPLPLNKFKYNYYSY